MPIEVSTLIRVFEVNGVEMGDPAPHLDPKEAVNMLAVFRPDLATCSIREPEERGGKLVYQLHRAIGSKAAGQRFKRLDEYFAAAKTTSLSQAPVGPEAVGRALQRLEIHGSSATLIMFPSEALTWVG